MKCKTRAWRAENPTRAALVDAAQDERRRIRKAANPEISKAYEAVRYAADPERQRARAAAYRSDPVKRKMGNAASSAWRAANPEKQRAAKLRWEAAHPELVAHYLAGWRARRRGNGGFHTLTQWRERCAEFDNRCVYCREEKPLTRDHDIPLTRGGSNDIANILPACRLCNSRKRTRTAAEFLSLSL